MRIQAEIAGLFLERFPRYAFFLPHWEEEKPTGPEADAAWLAKLPLEETEVLYLYGIDRQAALLLLPWLKQEEKRRLIFLEPQEGHIVHFLFYKEAKKILQEKQVEIVHLPKGREKSHLLQELAERYPARAIHLAAGPRSCNRRELQQIKLHLFRKTALTHAYSLERLHHHIPLSHLLHNVQQLSSAFYVNGLKDAFRGCPAILCGAGPSLSHSFDLLRQLETKALLIAGGSAIAALSAQGILPHMAVAIDPNPDEFERLKNSFAFEVPFLFSSRLFPSCLATCNGPFGYVRSGMSGIAELWFEEELGLTDPLLGERLSPESLSVTTLSMALAYHLGCNPILFDGLDLAYTQGSRYAEGVLASMEEPQDHGKQPVDRLLNRRDKQGKQVVSAVRWVMESNALSTFAKRSRDRRWINCTTGGLPLKGIESMPIAAAATLFSTERDLRGMVHAALRASPMPVNTGSIVSQKVEELRKSVEVCCSYLECLVRNEHQGQCALAECELKEELAYQILFYDFQKILPNPGSPSFWKAFQEQAERCLLAFSRAALSSSPQRASPLETE